MFFFLKVVSNSVILKMDNCHCTKINPRLDTMSLSVAFHTRINVQESQFPALSLFHFLLIFFLLPWLHCTRVGRLEKQHHQKKNTWSNKTIKQHVYLWLDTYIISVQTLVEEAKNFKWVTNDKTNKYTKHHQHIFRFFVLFSYLYFFLRFIWHFQISVKLDKYR